MQYCNSITNTPITITAILLLFIIIKRIFCHQGRLNTHIRDPNAADLVSDSSFQRSAAFSSLYIFLIVTFLSFFIIAIKNYHEKLFSFPIHTFCIHPCHFGNWTQVHHLFPPLAFLMDACLDLFDEDVQREVASPFMTQVMMMIKLILVMMMMKLWWWGRGWWH